MSEVEETIKRIMSHKGVVGVVIMDTEGHPIRSTLDNQSTLQHSALLQQLADKARHVVKELDPSNDMTFLRVRSKKHEIMLAPDRDYLMAVIQNPSS